MHCKWIAWWLLLLFSLARQACNAGKHAADLPKFRTVHMRRLQGERHALLLSLSPHTTLLGCRMEEMHGTIFMSLPSLLDPSLAPKGKHILHAFTPDWIDAWQVGGARGLSSSMLRARGAHSSCSWLSMPLPLLVLRSMPMLIPVLCFSSMLCLH